MSTSKNEVPAGARNYCLRESCDQTDTWILKLCDARDCGLTDYVFGNRSAMLKYYDISHLPKRISYYPGTSNLC